jgi:hypothetical protein
MPVTQITNAMALIRAALASALASLVGTFEGQRKAYWLQAPELAPLPLIVYQPQAAPQDASFLNGAGAGGLFTIKAIAATNAAAESLIASVPAVMTSLAIPGYGVRAVFVRELSLPPRDDAYTAGLIYDIAIYS